MKPSFGSAYAAVAQEPENISNDNPAALMADSHPTMLKVASPTGNLAWLRHLVQVLLLAMGMASIISARSQSANDGFDPNPNQGVTAMAVQADGKIVVGGSFTNIAGTNRAYIARLNNDGSADGAFDPGASGGIAALAIQPDGKILVVGAFAGLGGRACTNLGRLNLDGTLDTSFRASIRGTLSCLAVQADGKILVGGQFTMVDLYRCTNITRLNADGSIDASFNPGASGRVNCLAVQKDGKILVGGGFVTLAGQRRNFIGRLNPDGTIDPGFDPGFGADGEVLCLDQQADGKIVIGGRFTQFNGINAPYFCRLGPNGSLDRPFTHGAGDEVRALFLQPDGKVVLGGKFDRVAGSMRGGIARVNPDGTLDTNFVAQTIGDYPAGPTYPYVNVLARQPDGKILLAGEFTGVNGQPRKKLARVYGDGRLDRTFTPAPQWNIYALALQADGKVVVGGTFTNLAGQTRKYLGRLYADGSLDTNFNASALWQPDPQATVVYSLVVQPDGKILVGGKFTTLGGVARTNLARLNSDGTVDMSFNPNIAATYPAGGVVHCLALDPDGNILVGGKFNLVGGQPLTNLARIFPEGSVDLTFHPGPDNDVWSLAVQPDGRIVVGGYFSTLGDQTRYGLGRLYPDGTVDTAFPGLTFLGSYRSVYCVLAQPDGKILAGGDFGAIAGGYRNGLARLNPDGSLDAGFNPQVSNGAIIYSLVLQTDGKILLAGSFGRLGSRESSQLSIGRVNPDGSLDAGFLTGASSAVYALALQPDAKLLMAGSFDQLRWITCDPFVRLSTATDAASEDLQVSPGGESIRWLRKGAGPEIDGVIFESSLDGVNYKILGAGTRLTNGWGLDGLALPHAQLGYVRARGRTFGGYWNASGGIVESVRQFYLPNLPPIARCQDVVVSANAGCAAPASIDNGSADPDPGDTVTLTQEPPGPYPLGATLVTLTVRDGQGAVAQCSATVTVVDTSAPVANCPGNLVTNTTGGCTQIVNFLVTATDNCPAPGVVCRPPTGASFSVGVTKVECTATDGAGNTGQCSFTVTVADHEPPQVQCPADILASTDAGHCSKSNVTWSVSVTDNCGPVPGVLCEPPSGSTFTLGSTAVQCTASDAGGNAVSCRFTVTVRDNEPPRLAGVPADLTVQCWEEVPPPAQVTATDNCSQKVLLTLETNVAGLHPTVVTYSWTAIDSASNNVSARQVITVLDTNAPSLTCPADITVEFTDANGATVNFEPAATDNCGKAAAMVCVPASGTVFPIGYTEIHCTATDDSGNVASCQFGVAVLGALGVKQNVLNELVSVRAGTSNPEDGHRLDEAIRHLTEALDPACWVDQTHIQLRHGEKVFNEEKETVQKLNEVLSSKPTGNANSVLQECIERLVRADRLLAAVEIQECALAGIVSKKIDEDNKELAKGDEKAACGKSEDAIEHYKNGWKHALHLRLKTLVRLDSGEIHLEFIGTPGVTYTVQTSTNLMDWITVGTCVGDSDGNADFRRTGVTPVKNRFYRIVAP